MRGGGAGDTDGFAIENLIVSGAGICDCASCVSVVGVVGHINSKIDTSAGTLNSLTIDRLVAFTRLAAKDGDYVAESFKRIFELDEYKSAEGDVHMLLKVDSLQGDGASDVTATATGIGVRKGEILEQYISEGKARVAGELLWQHERHVLGAGTHPALQFESEETIKHHMNRICNRHHIVFSDKKRLYSAIVHRLQCHLHKVRVLWHPRAIYVLFVCAARANFSCTPFTLASWR